MCHNKKVNQKVYVIFKPPNIFLKHSFISASLIFNHRYSRSRLLTHRSGGVTCMINPRWRGNRAKNYKTLQGNQCFSRFTAYRCLESLRINIFWKELIIAEVLSTVCLNSAEFLVKISLVKCVVNWSLGQFETFVVQNMYF